VTRSARIAAMVGSAPEAASGAPGSIPNRTRIVVIWVSRMVMVLLIVTIAQGRYIKFPKKVSHTH